MNEVLRFHLLHSDPSETVLLRIFFPKTQRYDVYVDDVFVPPKNLDTSKPSYQLIPDDPSNPEQFFPTHSDPVGANYLQRREKFLHVLLKGGSIIDIKTSPLIVLTTGVVVDPDNFFEANVVANVAAMLGVSANNIRVTNVIREDSGRRRRKRATETVTMSFDIASAPTTNVNGGDGVTSGGVLSYKDLQKRMSNIVDKFQAGSCSSCDLQFSSLEVEEPIAPPKEAGPPATQEFGQVDTGGQLYSAIQQQEEATSLNNSLQAVVYMEPSGAALERRVPKKVMSFTHFAQQPIITVQTVNGDVVESLGHVSDPWMIEATLTGGHKRAVLLGTNPVPYLNGMANFTDLSVNRPGSGYALSFHVSHPVVSNDLPVSLGYTFRATKKRITLTIISTPQYINEKTFFKVQLALIDDESGMPIDPAVLPGQTLQGKIKLTNSKKGKLLGPVKFTLTDGAASEFTLNNLRINKPGTNYRYLVDIDVRPANWFLEVKSEGFDVLPENLIIPDNSITKKVSMKGIWGKANAVIGKEEEFASKLASQIASKVGGAYWGNYEVTVGRRPFVRLQVTGSRSQINDAVDDLCKKMKQKKLKVRIGRQKFIMSGLAIE
ncbi:hypothetical protein SK128_002602, partial [Halocaridina rubra]